MTIAANDRTITYTGNGVTVAYATDFPLFNESDVQVLDQVIATGTATTLVLSTDYTVSINSTTRIGTITLSVATAATSHLILNGHTNIVQDVDYSENDAFPAETHERALDRLTVIAQEQALSSTNSIHFSASVDADGTVSSAPALTVLRMNQDGDGVEFVDASIISAGVGGINTFRTIAIAGQTDVVADSPTDTLTLAAGSNVTLTTNATTDTVTIAASVTDPELLAIAGLTSAADTVPYFTGSGTAALATLTSAGRDLIDDASTSSQRTTLGLGTMATQAATAVSITGGSVAGITDLAVADGGTAASTAVAAAHNLIDNISLSAVTVASDDKVLIQDTSNSNILSSVTASQLVSGASAESIRGRNIIIGGNFDTNPWQRGTTFTNPANGGYTADRFATAYSLGDGTYDIKKTADAPTAAQAGIYTTNCLHVDCTHIETAVAAGEFAFIYQTIEGYNFAPLTQLTNGFTLTFWVKSTKTGIFCISFANSGQDKCFLAEYTVNTTNTWEKKTINVTTPPSAGTWDYTTGAGLSVFFTLMCGSTYAGTAGSWITGPKYCTSNQVNGFDSTSNDFKIALVQLEAGASSTTFENKNVGEVLTNCQRYYEKSYAQGTDPATNTATDLIFSTCVQFGTTSVRGYIGFKVPKRVAPTLVVYPLDGSPSGSINWYTTAGVGTERATTTSTGVNGFTIAQTTALEPGVTLHYTASAEL